jgi:hypothetical protein
MQCPGNLMFLPVSVNDKEFKVLLDSGATPSVIRESIVRQLGLESLIVPTNVMGSSAEGNTMPMVGQITLDVQFLNGRPLNRKSLMHVKRLPDRRDLE